MFFERESKEIDIKIQDYNTNNGVYISKKSFLNFNRSIKSLDYTVLELIVKMKLLKIPLKTFHIRLIL